MKLLQTLMRVWLPSLEMSIDIDLVAQNAFTFSYERAKNLAEGMTVEKRRVLYRILYSSVNKL